MQRSLPPMAAAAVLALLVLVPPGGAQDQQVFPGQCRDVDPADALARGHGMALYVNMSGDETIITNISAEQVGPGKNGTNETFLPIGIAGLVEANLLRARVDLDVDAENLEAEAWTSATLLDVNILDGLVTADVVRAAAYAQTDVRHADTDDMRSALVDVRVGGLVVAEVDPGLRIDLPPALFGNNSYVILHEQIDTSQPPVNGSTVWHANLTINMIHVVITDFDPLGIGLTPLEIIVSQAQAEAQTPNPFCGKVQAVDASAYVARVREELGLNASVLLGFEDINITGGRGHQQLVGVQVPENTTAPLVMLNVSETRVDGVINPDVDSRSRAMSRVLGACVLSNGTLEQQMHPESVNVTDDTDCLVSVQVARAVSNSFANGTTAMSWGEVEIVGLYVGGVDVCAELGFNDTCRPAPNTNIDIGLVNITLNQQEWDEPQAGHTGLYVRAIRIQVPGIADIIVSRAYSAADFFDVEAAVTT